jgi:hypothetical protein
MLLKSLVLGLTIDQPLMQMPAGRRRSREEKSFPASSSNYFEIRHSAFDIRYSLFIAFIGQPIADIGPKVAKRHKPIRRR